MHLMTEEETREDGVSLLDDFIPREVRAPDQVYLIYSEAHARGVGSLSVHKEERLNRWTSLSP